MHTSFTKSNGKSWEHSPTVSECDIFTFFYTFNPFEKLPAICKVVNKNNKKKENNKETKNNIKMKQVMLIGTGINVLFLRFWTG